MLLSYDHTVELKLNKVPSI